MWVTITGIKSEKTKNKIVKNFEGMNPELLAAPWLNRELPGSDCYLRRKPGCVPDQGRQQYLEPHARAHVEPHVEGLVPMKIAKFGDSLLITAEGKTVSVSRDDFSVATDIGRGAEKGAAMSCCTTTPRPNRRPRRPRSGPTRLYLQSETMCG